MKYLSIFALLLVICSFYNNPDPVRNTLPNENKSSLLSDPDKFYVIEYIELLGKKQVIGLSQLASKVEYVKLETNNDCTIGRNPSYLFTDSLIFVGNGDHILKFSQSEKFLQRIGKHGLGPEEIDAIVSLSLIPDKKPKVFMPINILNFQKALEENKKKKVNIKYPDKQSQLQKIVTDSDSADNPILMVVTLKMP